MELARSCDVGLDNLLHAVAGLPRADARMRAHILHVRERAPVLAVLQLDGPARGAATGGDVNRSVEGDNIPF